MTDIALDDLTRPIVGIENRTAQEVFDIMCDRFRRTSPSQVAPANPAQATDALKSAEKALRPFYDAVFNDNGDITVNRPHDYDEAVAGYFAYKKIERVIAAIGAGGQAVAEDIETQAWECDRWPAWLDAIVERTNDVADRLDMSSEQAHAYAILSALSQPHPADKRVVEALRSIAAGKMTASDAAYVVKTALSGSGAGGWRTKAADDVLAERKRQVEAEGWTPEHDDSHKSGEMAIAAACYALNATDDADGPEIRFVGAELWPWADQWWKPGNDRRNLVKAGALILAEIERLDRLPAAPQPKGE